MAAYINLLPPEERKKVLSFRQSIILLSSLAYIVLLFSIYVIGAYQLKTMRIEKVGLENQLKMIQPSLERLANLEQEQKALKARLELGQNLTSDAYLSELLILISNLTPEKITLTRLSYSDNNISFEGESGDFRAIAELIANLKTSDKFLEVELISSFTNKRKDGSIGFKIAGKLTDKG